MTNARVVNFGCKTNQYEGEALERALAALGMRLDDSAPPDVAIVNSCTVTERADRRARQAVMRIAREHPSATIYVTGCYAARAAAELAGLPNVAGVSFDKRELAELIAREVHVAHPPSGESSSLAQPGAATPHQQKRHGRAYLKIQDGCDRFCSYCIVPFVRPALRSEPVDAVLREARAIVDAGFGEIVLTGIHLGRYGADRSDGVTLIDVIRRVAATPNLARLRLSSIELPEVAEGLIDLLAANPVLCPHLHLPLQSGDDRVLAAMNRRYTAAGFLDTVRRLRARIPDVAITTDVIVGFPGESDEAFENTLRVCREAAFSRIHVFPFSARPGTKAAGLPRRLPARVITRRKHRLLALADDLALAFKQRFVGRTVEVLVEGDEADAGTGRFASGLTGHYLRVRFASEADLRGRPASVRVESVTPRLMTGRLRG